MILIIPANAQDKGQKKMHVVVEENGTVITDTSVIFDKDGFRGRNTGSYFRYNGRERPSLSRPEISMPCIVIPLCTNAGTCKKVNSIRCSKSAVNPLPIPAPILTLAGMRRVHTNHACIIPKMPAAVRNHANTCRMNHPDTCRHAERFTRKPGMYHEGQSEKMHQVVKVTGTLQAQEKEIRIIETRDDEKDMPEGCTKKTIEKKVIITEEGGKTEKIIILESSDEEGNKGSETKVTITKEGDKAEKTIILESPAETEKKTKKEN